VTTQKKGPVIPQEVIDAVGGALQRFHLQVWWQMPLVRLNGRTPRQAWASGDHTEVMAVIAALKKVV
jgi:hypothetical protein